MLGILGSLGLGGQVMTAATVGIIALYLFRVVKVGRLIAGAFGAAAFYALAILVFTAISIGLGWFDPQPDVVIGHVTTAIAKGWEMASGPIADLLVRVIERVIG